MFLGLIGLAAAAAKTVGSVPRNLFVDNGDFSGSWELSTNSAYDDHRILLVPASSEDRFGYAWRLTRAPPNVWDAEFRFKPSNTSAHTRGAIFMTSEFGPQGKIFGGPEKFDGAALLFEIKNNFIAYEYRVNNGKVVYTDSDIMAFVTLQLENQEFSIELSFTDDGNVKVTSEIMNRKVLIYEGVARTSVKKCWIAVTAESVENTSELSLVGVKSSFGVEEEPQQTFPDEEEDSTQNSGNKDVIAILDEILRVSRIANRSAKLRFVHNAVEKAMYKQTNSWKRRSYRMINDTQASKASLIKQLRFVQDSFDDYRMHLTQGLDEFKSTAIGIFRNLFVRLYEVLEGVKTASENNRVEIAVVLMEVIGVGEVVCLAVFALRFIRKMKRTEL